MSASTASAQLLTNGTGDAITVNRGDVVTINTAGTLTNHWVGLYAIGATHQAYQDWFYLNGTKSVPPAPINPATFGFQVKVPPGTYEFRLFAGAYNFVTHSGVVTVQPPALTINGVSAPATVEAEPAGSIEVEVISGNGNTTSWVGLYRGSAANASYLDWFYLNGTKTAPSTGIYSATVTMPLPAARGPYEVRLFAFNGTNNNLLATSTSVRADLTTPIAGGDGHTLVARPNGAVRSVGGNAAGQLGDGTTVGKTVPVELSGLADVISVAAGNAHSLALSASGAVYAWGANDYGQIGDDSLTQRASPTQLTLSDVVAVAAGDHHSLALTASGELFAWGLNDLGQLGTGNTTNSSVPVQVATSVLSIGAGGKFSLFVKLDGTVWGMGDNQWGTLGNQNYTNQTSPVPMNGGVTTAVAVQGGSQHSLILLQNGTVRSTGRNNLGQLGAASPAYRNVSAVIASLSNIVAIAAGDDFSLALDKDGTVWGWGDNASGQLGSATPSYRTSPATVDALSGIKYIAAGAGHTIAANTNRTISTVGENSFGQLGDGTANDRSTALASEGLSQRLPTPTLSVSTGTFESEFNVVVTAGIANSVIRYTTNGADPTESDPIVTSGSTIAIDHSLSLKVKAWKTDWLPSAVAAATYEMRVATPSLLPGSSTLTAPTNVSISTPTAGTVIRYTVDGSDPTSASPQYSGPVTVATATTMKARGFKAGWSDSTAGVGSYVMNLGTLEAPSIAPASGTYVGGVAVVISSQQPGATIRYTTDGSSPTGSSPIYASSIEVQDSPAMITAKAFHPDYTASADALRVYTLAAAPPTIEPAAGTFTTAQTVTITASAGAVIRYTTDGSDPNEASSLYSGPLTVDAGLTLKARAFPTSGWAPSEATSATLTFNYGTLDTPVVTPDGGAFQQAPEVTLSSTAGAAIRYTLDGLTPTESSTLYSGPFTLPAGGGELKAKAFQADWTSSAVMSEAYVIDLTPPTITTGAFPAPLSGWIASETTVSFSCSDENGITSCSSPIALLQDGPAQQITGTAIDTAGNQATASVTIGVDRTAPTVTVTAPVNWQTISTSQITLTGTLADALSGVANAKCNGVSATIVDGTVNCVVSLRPGRNNVVLQVTDVAGNSSSAGVTVFRVGTATTLVLAPSHRALLVDETTALTLRDEFGVEIVGGLWSSSDPAIVSVSTDDPPVLTALGPGTIVITAEKNGLSAVATLTVVSGTSLVAGTTRWSNASPPGSTVTGSFPTNRVDVDVPSLFSIEHDGTNSQVRALTNEGEALWVAAAPAEPIMADSFGGLVAGIGLQPYHFAYGSGSQLLEFVPRFKGYERFAGPSSTEPWRFESIDSIGRPAQAPDGTIYAVERYNTGANNLNGAPIIETQIIVLDGATGAVRKRIPLARERRGIGCAASVKWEAVPAIEGPIVGTDGYGYLVVRTFTNNYTVTGPGCNMSNIAQDVALTLWRIAPSGATSPTTFYARHCDRDPSGVSICDHPPTIHELFPDGVGGTLIKTGRVTAAYFDQGQPEYASEYRLTRITDVGIQFDVLSSDDDRILMIGDVGRAFVTDGESVHAMNVTDWTSIWSNTNPSLEPVVALPHGGVAMHDVTSGTLVEYSATGAAGQSAAFGGRWSYQSAFGIWTGVDDTSGRLTARVSLPLNEAQSSYTFLGGVGTGQRAPGKQPITSREGAALIALDNAYPLSRLDNSEFGGLICSTVGGFRIAGPVTQHIQDQVTVEDSMCPTGAIAAHYHTHPPKESSIPSGNDAPGFVGGDFGNAFAHAAVPYYLRAPIPNSPTFPPTKTHDLKYWWTGSGRRPSQNTCVRLGLSGGVAQWSPFLLVSDAQANCNTPIP